MKRFRKPPKMFSKFTSMLQSAVEALAPPLPVLQEFTTHWKAVTYYFIENKEHKKSVDQTSLPGHLNEMLGLLQNEEINAEEPGATGPCLEYLLQHKILETLYTLARTDCPPGMKQVVLQFFSRLLSWLRQPLLPHVHVHRPVQRLVRLCGEVCAAPEEADEITLVCIVCAKLKSDPYLANFFIETPKPLPRHATPEKGGGGPPPVPCYTVVDALLNLMHSPDAWVAVKACEGLMLCASLPEDNAAYVIIHNTDLTGQLTRQLCELYQQLPKVMDPTDIQCTEAKWGLDMHCPLEERQKFQGRRTLIAFLSWLDFLDQLSSVAHPLVATALGTALRENFLEELLLPAVLQPSETASLTAVYVLVNVVKLLYSPALLTEIVTATLGTDTQPEGASSSPPPITDGSVEVRGQKFRTRLLERCNHLSEELSIATLKLFDILLYKPKAEIIHNLILRNLLGQGYIDLQADNNNPCEEDSNGEVEDPDIPSKQSDIDMITDHVESSATSPQKDKHGDELQISVEADTNVDMGEAGKSIVTSVNSVVDDVIGEVDDGKNEVESNGNEENDVSSVSDLKKDQSDTVERSVQHSEECSAEGGSKDGSNHVETSVADQLEDIINSTTFTDGVTPLEGITPLQIKDDLEEYDLWIPPCSIPSSPRCNGSDVSVHSVVNSWLNMLPEEAKSSTLVGDSGYDTYLRDAHRQYAELSSQCRSFSWPERPVSDPEYTSTTFYEGSFLSVLFDRLGHLLDQSYAVNLQLTSLLSHLALLPHPNLHQYLLLPRLSTSHSTRTLASVIKRVSNDVQARMEPIPDFQKRLVNVRRQLMGFSSTYRSTEHGDLLAGVIILEEFCKELAAIAFVKYHESTSDP